MLSTELATEDRIRILEDVAKRSRKLEDRFFKIQVMALARRNSNATNSSVYRFWDRMAVWASRKTVRHSLIQSRAEGYIAAELGQD